MCAGFVGFFCVIVSNDWVSNVKLPTIWFSITTCSQLKSDEPADGFPLNVCQVAGRIDIMLMNGNT